MIFASVTCGPVLLRLPTSADAEALYQLASDPELTRYLQWPPHDSVNASLEYIQEARSLWDRRLAWLPSIFRSDGELVGGIGISHLDRANRRAELGTWIGRPYQRAGYNLAAKAAAFHYAFHVLGLHRLELVAHVDNESSLRSLAALPGVEYEGLARMRIWKDGAPHDAHVHAITSATYDPTAWPEAVVVPN